MAIDWDLIDRERKLSEELRAIDRRALLDVCAAYPLAPGGHYPRDLGAAMVHAESAIRELGGALKLKRKLAVREAVIRARAHCQHIVDTAEKRDSDANECYAARVRALEAKLAELRETAPAEA